MILSVEWVADEQGILANPDGPESLCVCLLCYPNWDPESDVYEGRVKTLRWSRQGFRNNFIVNLK